VKNIQVKELDGQLVLQVAGRLAGAFVSDLDSYWRAVRALQPNRKISIDLKRVTRIDQAGWRLLRSMHGNGVDFLRAALAMNELWRSRSASMGAGQHE
jgi:anti-anti-sigma regulatory factor